MAVQSAEDRVENDPQLQSRGMYVEMEHPALGRQKFQGPPFKLAKSPASIHRPAPLIGQHTREILQELLEMSLDEIRAGYEDGTFWPPSIPKYPYVEEALQ